MSSIVASSSSSSSQPLDPTTRTRTGLFLSYRDSRARPSRFSRSKLSTYDDPYAPSDEHEGLMGPTPASLEVDLPPKWVDFSDQVRDVLADTQSKISTLEKLHAKHVLPGFADRSQEEREIDSLTTDITRGFRRCQTLIQKIGSSGVHVFPPNQRAAQNEGLAAKNVQRGLAAQVQDLSATFRKKQRVYMEKLQGHAIKNQDLLIASGTISLKGSEGMTAVDEDVAAANQSQTLTHLDSSLHLQTRDRELTEIAKSIASLAELFKDLSVLVIDQGTLLDSVEYNIEQTAVYVGEAATDLKQASTYDKSIGRRKCIFLLLLIIFGLILVLIFKPRRPSSSTTPSTPPPSSEPSVKVRISSRIMRHRT